jgi:hypothetical protein
MALYYDHMLRDGETIWELSKDVKNGGSRLANMTNISLKIGYVNEFCHGILVWEDIETIFTAVGDRTEEIEILFSIKPSGLPALDCFQNIKKITFSPKDGLYPKDTEFIISYLNELPTVKVVTFENIYPDFKNVGSDTVYLNIESMIVRCNEQLMGCDFQFHRFPNLKTLDIRGCTLLNPDAVIGGINGTLNLTELLD